jgi:hypothetical protein
MNQDEAKAMHDASVENPRLYSALKGESMNLINFIVWLSAGAVIGWFASRMVKAEHRRPRTLLTDEARST